MKQYAWLIAVLLIIVLPVFSHLDQHPLRLWDESRLATNAFEMHINGKWLVTTFTGAPDMWNTKPPAMVWLMTLSIKTFGVNELAFRLPAALCGVACCLLLFWFCSKKLNNPQLGFFSCLVLITSRGFVDSHRIRTADYDALLTLATTIYCLFFYLYVETGKTKHFVVFISGLMLAALTKGVAGLLFLPALLLYALFTKKLRSILRDRRIYLGILSFCMIVIGYYFIRESLNPGYIQAVFDNELGGRYMQTLEDHKAPFSFYMDCLQNEDLKWWILFLPIGMIAAVLAPDNKYGKMSAYLLLLSVSYLLIISSAQTKLEWYSMPVFPFLAIIIAFVPDYCFRWISKATQSKPVKIGLISFFIFMLWQPYNAILNLVMYEHPPWWPDDNYAMASYMSDVLHGRRNIKGYIFTDDCVEDQNILGYYEMVHKDQQISLKHIEDYSEGDKVIVFKESMKNKVERRYNTSVIYDEHFVKVYNIHGIKKNRPFDSSSGFQ